MTELSIPENLARHADDPARAPWLAALPAVIAHARELWSLVELGAPFEPGGQTAWVAPARSLTAGEVVLKVSFRHYEAWDEAKGLREWNGAGTVRVLESADLSEHTGALLLERVRPGEALSRRDEAEQDRVLAGLLPRLWRSPQHASFRPLSEMCDAWADGCEARTAAESSRLDPGLIRDGVALFRSLPRDPTPQVLLCTDLHAENVLSAEREPWLVIDPKPYVGDRTYDVLQHILNCPERLARDPLGFAAHIAGLFDLDVERLALWLFARCIIDPDALPDPLRITRALAPPR